MIQPFAPIVAILLFSCRANPGGAAERTPYCVDVISQHLHFLSVRLECDIKQQAQISLTTNHVLVRYPILVGRLLLA